MAVTTQLKHPHSKMRTTPRKLKSIVFAIVAILIFPVSAVSSQENPNWVKSTKCPNLSPFKTPTGFKSYQYDFHFLSNDVAFCRPGNRIEHLFTTSKTWHGNRPTQNVFSRQLDLVRRNLKKSFTWDQPYMTQKINSISYSRIFSVEREFCYLGYYGRITGIDDDLRSLLEYCEPTATFTRFDKKTNSMIVGRIYFFEHGTDDDTPKCYGRGCYMFKIGFYVDLTWDFPNN
jgi:hypothetical protein